MPVDQAQEPARNRPEINSPGLAAHGPALLLAAKRAHEALVAAEKIVRGGGHPKTADVIAERAADLHAAVRLASGDAP